MKIKIIHILMLLLLISLMWNLLYIFPPDLSYDEFGKPFREDTVLNRLLRIYRTSLPSLPSILVSCINVIYAILGLHKTYKLKEPNKKHLINYSIYAVFALGVLTLNCITLKDIFEGFIAG